MDFNVFYKSIILDKLTAISVETYDSLFRAMIPNLYVPILHPEMAITLNDNFMAKKLNYFGNFYLSFLNTKFCATIVSFFSVLVNFLLIYYFCLVFIIFFFNFISIQLVNKNNTDAEQVTSLILYESEKEIASIDDILPLIIALFLTFGIYFYFNVFQYVTLFFNGYIFTFLVLPAFFCFVFIIPLLLLYDFGFYCFIYLRGSGNTALLSAELLYDFINLFAYYIRVVIQCARLILMLTAIGSFQELMFYINFDFYILNLNDSNNSNYYLVKYTLFNVFFKFTNFFLFLLYEIFHAYFVLTIQTIAFFAMVF